MICYCLAIRSARLRKWLEAHPDGTLDEMIEGTEAGSWCHACREDLVDFLTKFRESRG